MKFERSLEGRRQLVLEDRDEVLAANKGYWEQMAFLGTPMDPNLSVMSAPLTRGGEYPKIVDDHVSYLCIKGMEKVLLKDLE